MNNFCRGLGCLSSFRCFGGIDFVKWLLWAQNSQQLKLSGWGPLCVFQSSLRMEIFCVGIMCGSNFRKFARASDQQCGVALCWRWGDAKQGALSLLQHSTVLCIVPGWGEGDHGCKHAKVSNLVITNSERKKTLGLFLGPLLKKTPGGGLILLMGPKYQKSPFLGAFTHFFRMMF